MQDKTHCFWNFSSCISLWLVRSADRLEDSVLLITYVQMVKIMQSHQHKKMVFLGNSLSVTQGFWYSLKPCTLNSLSYFGSQFVSHCHPCGHPLRALLQGNRKPCSRMSLLQEQPYCLVPRWLTVVIKRHPGYVFPNGNRSYRSPRALPGPRRQQEGALQGVFSSFLLLPWTLNHEETQQSSANPLRDTHYEFSGAYNTDEWKNTKSREYA